MTARNHLLDKEAQYLSSSPDWVAAAPISATVDEPKWNTSNNAEEDWRETNGEDKDDPSPIRNSLQDSIVREDFTLDFFRPLQQADQEARKSALDSILAMFEESLNTERKEFIKAHLATITRYAHEVPYEDLTREFKKLLKRLEQCGIPLVPSRSIPSSFVPAEFFPPVDTADSQLRSYFADLFLQTGRVSHLNRVLLLHQSHFQKHYETYNFIMRETGLLPVDWRHYIAILAASRQNCRWLVYLHETDFLLCGGDRKWLSGIEAIPKKLANLLNVNQILCHQPWLITKEHIASLVKGEDSWSIGELVHAMLIICTIKALSGIIFGCGITAETDFPEIAESKEEDKEDKEAPNVKADTNKIMELLKKWERNDSEESDQDHFIKAESEGEHQSSIEHGADLSRYIGKYTMKHMDFDVRAKNYSIFRVQDYCWKEQGFELVRRFLPDAAILVDEEFDHIYNMTYNMFNLSANVDTLPLRCAIWQYVQRIKGMFHDDYNYQEVNVFLNKASKSFVKKISCDSPALTKSDFNNLGYELKPDEKVHVALLAVESAKQSELLYGLHAVFQHMYNH